MKIESQNLFMLTQKYRSESDLVIWLWFGFEARSLSRPSYRQGMSVGTYAEYRHCTSLVGCLYGVIFNTSHYFFVIGISLMEPIRFVYYTKICFNESLS